jgi:hypothetical protein
VSGVSDKLGLGRVGGRQHAGDGAGGWPRRLALGLWRRWSLARVFDPPSRSEWPVGLRRARMAGLVLLAIQLIALCWWSSALASRFALTRDFALYEQAARLIAHGHLDPASSVIGENRQFLSDHFDILFYPVVLLWAAWPHPVTLLWVQDLATVAAEAIAFGWICDIAARRGRLERTTRAPVALVALGAVLLLCDPWVTWASSFDFHTEAMASMFAVAAARDIFRGRRRAWLWAALCCLNGDLAASYIGVVGVSAMLAGRPWWRQGAAMAVAGFAWMLFAHALSGAGSPLSGLFAPLVAGTPAARPGAGLGSLISAIVAHPGRPLRILWSNRLNIWAALSPTGVIGWLWLPVLVPVGFVLLTSNLGSPVFGFPGFQTLLVTIFGPIGTVALGAGLVGRALPCKRWVLPALFVVVLVNALAWCAVWLPRTATQWLDVSPGAASVLRRVQVQIGSNDQVVASQGVAGAFADRLTIDLLFNAESAFPVRARKVWVILAPAQGTETASVAGIYGDIALLAENPSFRLAAASDGIWAFEWSPPNGTRTLTLAPTRLVTPVWGYAGPAGTPMISGPSSDWYVEGNGRPGYILDQAYWREGPGWYRATVSLAVSSTANVEVWDATTSTLLSRQSVPGTDRRATVQVTVDLRDVARAQEFAGWGIWRTEPLEPNGDDLEIRVWSPGGNDHVAVYTVSLEKTGDVTAASDSATSGRPGRGQMRLTDRLPVRLAHS